MTALSFTRADVDSLAEEFESRSAQELLAWAAERFDGRIVLTCSWQKQSSVLVHMLSEIGATVRIAELDTGLFFPESHATRERLVERYGVRVERIAPARTVAEQDEDEGPRLWERDPDRCCALRKVAPLARALEGMDAWITGVRRAQSAARAQSRKIEYDASRDIVRLLPLADWTDEDVTGYLYAHDVPYNPLHDQGYPSIGCMPCTRPVRPGEDPRAGRWAGRDKDECGLHLPAAPAAHR